MTASQSRLRTLVMALGITFGLLSAAATAPAAPVPGVDWVARVTPSPASSWKGITYGNGKWVAVGTSGSVMTSTDGDAWTAVPSVPTGDWYDVHFANGLFVAVSDYSANQVMTSPDGSTWTVTATATSTGIPATRAYFQGVTYGNGTWLVVSRQTTPAGKAVTLTSTDGQTWTTNLLDPTSTGADDQSDVAFGNGTFVAVYDSTSAAAVRTSTDGVNWTESATPVTPGRWEDVTFGEGRFVAVGRSGAVMYSTDNGATWTLATAASNRTWTSVAYGSGLFVAVSDQAGTNTNERVMTSPDGITWTAQTAAAPNSWQNVASAHGRFVAVADSGTDRAMTSGDMIIPVPLTVARKGDGVGTVTSTPTGIDCGSACTVDFAQGTAVTLTATSAAGSTFTGWSDGCSGAASTCTLTVSAATTVTATFAKTAEAAPAAATARPRLEITKAKGTSTTISALVRASAAGRAVMTGTVGGKPAFKPGKHDFTKPSTATIRAALNDRVRALLRIRDVRVKITVRFIAADGRTTTSTRTVLLKKITVRPEPVTG